MATVVGGITAASKEIVIALIIGFALGITAVLDAALIGRAPGITGSVGGILQSKRGRGESNRDRSAQ